jgi:hypothetical protein
MVGPSVFPGDLNLRSLKIGTSGVMPHLLHGTLANVNNRFPSQMISRDQRVDIGYSASFH